MNQMPWPQWQAAADRIGGTPLHGPRLIHDDPPVWEFGTPVGGTYPLAYEPAWWTRGLEPRVEAGPQVQALATNVVYYFDLFVRAQGGFLAVVLVLCVLSENSARRWLQLDGPTVLMLWALAALGMYALVYAEARYVAPFVVLLWAGLLARVRLPAGEGYRRVAAVGGIALALLVWVNIGAANVAGLAGLVGFEPGPTGPESADAGVAVHAASHPEIATALQELGLEQGDKVAFIGYSYSAYWARLARVRIIAEIRPEESTSFWTSTAEQQERLLAALRQAGVGAVIAEPPPMDATTRRWQPLGASGYLVRLR